MVDRALVWLRKGAVLMFLAAIVAGLVLPVYTDEIGWRFQERAGLDGVDKMFAEQCGPNTLAVPAWFMWPARWYSAVFNTVFADPFWVRVSGVLYALAFAFLVWKLIARAGGDRASRSLLVTLAAGLMMLGLTPLLLVWSRPEQPVLLALAGTLVIAMSGWREHDRVVPVRTAWLRTAGIVMLAAIALSYHMKGLFGFPVFATAIFLAARGRTSIAPRVVAFALLVVLTGWALHYWSARLQCPGDDVLRAFYARHNFATALTAEDGLPGLLALAGRIVGNASLLSYIALVAPNPNPMSEWLMPGQISGAAGLAWAKGLALLWLVVLAVAAWRLALAGIDAVRTRRADPAAWLSVALFVVAIGWSAMQMRRNTYEAAFVLPLLMLAVVLALSLRREEEMGGDGGPGRRWLVWPAVLAGLAGTASVPAIGVIYGPSLVRSLSMPAYIGPTQRNSLSIVGYGAAHAEIQAAARLCRIPPAEQARALMVDDLTYFAFMRSQLPQHRLGVTGALRGRIGDPVAYLRSRGSDGIIVGCHVLPGGLRARARAVGRFCCLSPATGW